MPVCQARVNGFEDTELEVLAIHREQLEIRVWSSPAWGGDPDVESSSAYKKPKPWEWTNSPGKAIRG